VSALEFISSIAWPVTVLIIVILFRKSFSEMLSGPLQRLKAGPVEAVWRDIESEVKADLSREPNSAESFTPRNDVAAELASLAERVPSTAVLEAYERVRSTLIDVAENPPIDQQLDLKRLSAPSLAELANQHGRIRAETVQAVEGLGVLRNLVAHGQGRQVTTDRALDYLTLVDATLFAIRMNQKHS
jgi:hypothetical protein